LTHFHADHLTATPEGAEVYAPWGEELFVSSVKARLFFTHGVYMENAVYKGNDLKVAGLVKPGDRGDALFGEKVLEKYGVPYLMDVDAFLASLERIKSLEPEILVMGHGPVAASRRRIVEMIETNRAAVERAVKLVVNALPGDLTAVSVRVIKASAAEHRWENVLLTMTTVRAVLSKLSREGRVYIDENGVWRIN
jgi:glyoxylase-like metal-dependent hydrolase (beta-lactamase superfamily II)